MFSYFYTTTDCKGYIVTFGKYTGDCITIEIPKNCPEYHIGYEAR